MNPSDLSRQIADFATARTEALVARFLPGFVIPRFFCGHWRASGSEEANLAFLLGHLHRLSVGKIAGTPVEHALALLLRAIDGAKTDTFYSFFLADALLAYGPFANNPLLEDFTEAERENLRRAVDTTQMYDPATQTLRGYPNNYWAVLARCEFLRQQLGLLPDDAILQVAGTRLQALLFENPLGFFNDSRDTRGRYDIYTADVHLFCEPLWPAFDPGKIEANLRQHTRLIEKIAMENGASFVFGRSIGALSLCLTMEFLAMSLARGLAADPDRALRLIAHAFTAFTAWFEDDLIAAHRHGNTEGYRGVHRVLQMTLNCLDKLCYVAEKLHETPTPSPSSAFLFPDIGEWIPFDAENGGVWMFRNAHLTFQLPLINGGNADYAPFCRSPGLLENPIESPMYCGVPRLAARGEQFTVRDLPTRVEKTAAGLVVTHTDFAIVSNGGQGAPVHGQRTATYRVEADTLFIDEHLTFDELPDAISWFIPESTRPLDIAFTSDSPLHHDTVAVAGMTEWRSAWGPLKTLHQAHLTPAREVRFACAIRPRLRVSVNPGRQHDYTRALLEKMPTRLFAETPQLVGTSLPADVAQLTRGMDILHVGWPEYLFSSTGLEEAEFDRQVLAFVDKLAACDVRIVWTMHNRRPHYWPADRGRRLYEAWARVADAVIHHSEWGRRVALRELPYRPDALHVVIPHGHFGEQMRSTRSRAEIEAALGLPPCAMRFGLLGRAQPEKRAELIMRAFTKGARDGQQLVLTAYDDKTPRPTDPRIIFLPRQQWMSREDIAGNTHLCDALVSAHLGDSYFTSGMAADSIGTAIPMLVPRWEYFDETFGDAAFYHDNTEESLAALFASLKPGQLASKHDPLVALQPRHDWSAIAEQTLALYRSLGRKRR
jgi:hypothetical protein